MKEYVDEINRQLKSGKSITDICDVIGGDELVDVVRYKEVYNFLDKVTGNLLYKKWWFVGLKKWAEYVYTGKIVDGEYVLIDVRFKPTAIVRFSKASLEDYARTYDSSGNNSIDKNGHKIFRDMRTRWRLGITPEGDNLREYTGRLIFKPSDGIKRVLSLDDINNYFLVINKDNKCNIFRGDFKRFVSEAWFVNANYLFPDYKGFVKLEYSKGGYNIFSAGVGKFAVDTPYNAIIDTNIYRCVCVRNYEGHYNIIVFRHGYLSYVYRKWFDNIAISSDHIDLWGMHSNRETFYGGDNLMSNVKIFDML